MIQSVRYNEAPELLRRQFALLSHRASAGMRALPADTVPVQHDPTFDALSFCASLGGEIVSYASLRAQALPLFYVIYGATEFVP